MTQQEFFDDTIKHFNSNNRGTGEYGCSYVAGCAIGRHIKDKKLCAELDEFANSEVRKVFLLLPPELQRLGVDFLDKMQKLHDDLNFWNTEGLSGFGKQRAGEIAREFNLNYVG